VPASRPSGMAQAELLEITCEIAGGPAIADQQEIWIHSPQCVAATVTSICCLTPATAAGFDCHQQSKRAESRG
jgi:hypothetical protein